MFKQNVKDHSRFRDAAIDLFNTHGRIHTQKIICTKLIIPNLILFLKLHNFLGIQFNFFIVNFF
jgi:hypothetical protein